MLAPLILVVSLAGASSATAVVSSQAAPPAAPAAAATTTTMTGAVHDSTGRVPIRGATVTARTAGVIAQTTTGADGSFSLALPPNVTVDIDVHADGFEDGHLSASSGANAVAFLLHAARVSESVTVTATRSEEMTTDVPASVSVLDRATIEQSPAVVADDVLRELPAFSLFRRTSSLAANPTAQGVSLRGLGPSGVSRTLVLVDGVPANDPFGGWVYWSRIPLQDASRIEVVDSPSSSLYGNYAMGGVINVVTNPPTSRSLEFTTQYGSLNSPMGSFAATDVWHKLAVSLDGNAYNTDGYPIVASGERGAVDNHVTDNFRNVNLKLSYDPSSRVHAFFGTGYFDEHRNNGQVSTVGNVTENVNRTRWASTNGGVRVKLPDQSTLEATVFTDAEHFFSNFLAVPTSTPNRSIGRVSLDQTVPTDAVGGMVQWSRLLGSRQAITIGTDWRWIKGDSNETGFDTTTGTTVTLQRVSGGRQQFAGLFAQDLITPTSRLTLTLSARMDHWKNYDAHNLEMNEPSGTPTANNVPNLPNRTDNVGSPHVGALYHVTSRLDVWGDYGYGFRAPTLNELYRRFTQGTTTTLPNNQLGPERLKGGETGVTVAPVKNATVRVTWFDNVVNNPVSNVTISQSGATVMQMRQNLGQTQIWGVETEVEYRLKSLWKVTAGYQYDNATVTQNPSNTALVGNFLPQVPKNRGSVQVTYDNPRLFTATLDVEGTGVQFDDDQNARIVPGYTTIGLPKYALVGFRVSRDIGSRIEAFIGAQNVLNQLYYVGTLPTTVGSPREVTGGVRVKLGK